MTPLAWAQCRGLPLEAVVAGAAPVAAAGAAETEDDPVADGDEALGPGAELLDDADGLVADGLGPHPVPVAPGQVEVGVADAGGGDPHDGVVGFRYRAIDVLDEQFRVPDAHSLHGRHATRTGATPAVRYRPAHGPAR